MANVTHPVGVINGISAPELENENIFNANYVIEIAKLDANPADDEFGITVNLYIHYDHYNESGIMESVKSYYGKLEGLFVSDLV